MRFSPASSGFRKRSFWSSVPFSSRVSMVASSGPCVLRESAPRKLSPSSIWTSALASGLRPMPPCSSGMKGHHSPCDLAFLRSPASTSSKFSGVHPSSAGMHSFWTNSRTVARTALVSAGISKSIIVSPSVFPPRPENRIRRRRGGPRTRNEGSVGAFGPQKIASALIGEPVPVSTASGPATSRNSQRPSSAAVSATASRSWLSKMSMPMATIVRM